MKKEYVCIVCPSSCRLSVEEVNGEITVIGNDCRRGYFHGIKEYTAPVRMLTTTIAIKNADLPRLPVIGNDEVPKEKLRECLDILYKTIVSAPIKCGDIIINNICNTGVDICASRSINIKGE